MEETPEQRTIADKREALRGPEQTDAENYETQERRRRWLRGLGCLGAILLPIIGTIIGLGVGASTAPKPDPNAMLDFTGLDRVVYGAVIGFFSGLFVALLLTWLLRRSD